MEKLRKNVCALLLAVLVLFTSSASSSSFQNDYDAIEQTVQSVLMLGLLDENEVSSETAVGLLPLTAIHW